MAFTIPYSYKGLPETPAAYVRLDQVTGSAIVGWTGSFRIYADHATRIADIGDDLVGAGFTKHVDYQVDVAPCGLLYEAAKADFPDAVDV